MLLRDLSKPYWQKLIIFIKASARSLFITWLLVQGRLENLAKHPSFGFHPKCKRLKITHLKMQKQKTCFSFLREGIGNQFYYWRCHLYLRVEYVRWLDKFGTYAYPLTAFLYFSYYSLIRIYLTPLTSRNYLNHCMHTLLGQSAK